jgi:hypothetical protein
MKSIFCALMIPFFIMGCTVGSDFKEKGNLKKQDFVNLNEVPDISQEKQKSIGKEMQQYYNREKQCLERKRDNL